MSELWDLLLYSVITLLLIAGVPRALPSTVPILQVSHLHSKQLCRNAYTAEVSTTLNCAKTGEAFTHLQA